MLKIGDKLIMVDSGSGVGQWQPTAVSLPDNLKAAGIDPAKISTMLISHFHPDHIFGLMEKGTNAPNYPNAELIVSAAEYRWWTEPGRVEKLPEARKPLGTRIQSVSRTGRISGWSKAKRKWCPASGLSMRPGIRRVIRPSCSRRAISS